MNASVSGETIIWRLTDGKPGHESQSLGLAHALQRMRPCQLIDIPVSGKLAPFYQWLSGVWPAGAGLPLPDLIIGAGHRTHFSMLAAKRAYGGKTVLMMQPSLPVGLFDLCLIPEHDEYHGGGNFLQTRGVLNPLNATGSHHANQSLIMLGGPSKHCGWDNTELMQYIRKLLSDNPNTHYTLTTSRRTPAETLQSVQLLEATNLEVVPFEQTAAGWVAEQLARVSSAWISEDSVSMVYEALTARVAVGTLPVPVKRQNRVSNGLQKLLTEKLIVRFDHQQNYQQALQPVNGFIEADRCAEWIEANWLSQLVPGRAAIANT
ncbi:MULTISPECIES: mitochondrial fission ELM1 family protein [unclassified Methylophaga]|uniref:mitochondrial fission ELM1 family protein n=1 Tax=unclassified Methylophaga TaxID=2629249 RepID=UPI000C4D64E7|nr:MULTISPECIES: mitochondrial fission ELM1 family protein [unclassified Methylophaga]MAM29050.1 nucleoside-diphosphate sugar epimerase [Flavobacteriaceae bacterium]MAL50719.1 nucleoside-diphosphate sugar epimerase [Methylophaga sp.]MBP23986.1 nucleoside-diphosphate sugar epimerase [Methylophaga sp.]HAD32655.1 nucleoside-diphosphate sugar epimerase [Methylophaga sp.]HCC80802.1 nucleoside-diphosphate sugar epimerase [Methylophaga sp.]